MLKTVAECREAHKNLSQTVNGLEPWICRSEEFGTYGVRFYAPGEIAAGSQITIDRARYAAIEKLHDTTNKPFWLQVQEAYAARDWNFMLRLLEHNIRVTKYLSGGGFVYSDCLGLKKKIDAGDRSEETCEQIWKYGWI